MKSIGSGVCGALMALVLVAARAPAQEASIEADLYAANALSRAFEHAAEKVGPAVVHITSEAEIQRYRRDRLGRRYRVGTPELRENGLGSGVVIDASEGYVLTNHHVIAQGDRLVVRLHDDREIEAELIGSDEATDLAVLKIDADGLVAAPYADSDGLRIGEWVLALGSPFGFESSVTAGIVSAKGRSLSRDDNEPSYQEFIQTDAAINPGNSGGPLINLSGQIVGINSAIISTSRQSAGLGFAIPSAIAERVVDSIIANGRVRRGYLGVMMIDLSPEKRMENGLDPDVGVGIEFVQTGTPAERAGLEAGDIILRIDGREVIGGINRLRNLISLTPPGEEIEIDVLRSQRPVQVNAVIADSTEIRAELLSGEFLPELGAIVRVMTRPLSREMGYRRHVPGLVVLEVQSGTAASEAGLEVGDILTGVGGQRIQGPEALVEALRRGGSDPVVIQLVRGTMRGTVEVQVR